VLRSSCVKLQKKVLEYFYGCFYFSEICIPSIRKVRWCFQLLWYVHMTGIVWLWVLIGCNTEWFIAVHLPRLQYAKITSLYFGSLVIPQGRFVV